MFRDSKSCFDCTRNLDYLNRDGYANCGLYERVGVSKKTSPDSAMFCEYYQDKYVDGIVQDLLRLPKQSENEIIDEEKSNSSNHITYRYAYNENKDIVDVFTIDANYRKQHKFYCISCGREMSAHLKDEKRRRHFQHVDKCSCSSESYFHMLAKEMFKKAYDKAEEFYLNYSVTEKCNAEGCIFRQNSCDTHKAPKQIPLKKYFPVCTLEENVKGEDGNTYRADILLSNPKKEKYKLLIEIRVSHECTEEKKNSGLHIVEISVNSEEEAIKLGSCNSLEEGGNVVLFKFKKEECNRIENTIYRYAHIPNVKTFVKEISCSQQGQALFEDADVEIDIIKEDASDIKGIENFFNIRYSLNVRNCNTCSHLKSWGETQECVFCNLEELPQFSCDNYQRNDDYYDYHFQQDKYRFVKGNVRNDYRIFVHGPHKFFNCEAIYDVIKDFVIKKQNENNVILVGSDNIDFLAGLNSAAERLGAFIEVRNIEWDRYNKRAPYEFVYRVINDNSIDAVIVFTNGEDNVCNKAVEIAESKNKLLVKRDITKIESICPKCGGNLILKNGKYGMFWGCNNYPECQYIKKYTGSMNVLL